jgi:hypothetical protein
MLKAINSLSSSEIAGIKASERVKGERSKFSASIEGIYQGCE